MNCVFKTMNSAVAYSAEHWTDGSTTLSAFPILKNLDFLLKNLDFLLKNLDL